MRKLWPYVIAGFVGAVFASVFSALPAIAGSIKTWSSGETITAADLNSNFNHIHNAAESSVSTSRIANNAVTSAKILDGTIVSADISNGTVTSADIADGAIANVDIWASAAIDHSKLATPTLVPKLLWTDKDDCGAASCTAELNVGVTSVTGNGTGGYTVVFTARANANYSVLVSSHKTQAVCVANVATFATTGFTVSCVSSADGTTGTDAAFSFMVMDND